MVRKLFASLVSVLFLLIAVSGAYASSSPLDLAIDAPLYDVCTAFDFDNLTTTAATDSDVGPPGLGYLITESPSMSAPAPALVFDLYRTYKVPWRGMSV
jgi:hypothetical protein